MKVRQQACTIKHWSRRILEVSGMYTLSPLLLSTISRSSVSLTHTNCYPREIGVVSQCIIWMTVPHPRQGQSQADPNSPPASSLRLTVYRPCTNQSSFHRPMCSSTSRKSTCRTYIRYFRYSRGRVSSREHISHVASFLHYARTARVSLPSSATSRGRTIRRSIRVHPAPA